MAALIEAIELKRKMFFEPEGVPYHCLDVDVSTPTARGGQTLVRVKMRNLLTRAVFDRTFKAGDKFDEPDLEDVEAVFLYSDGHGWHFMDQGNYETLTFQPETLGEDRLLLTENTGLTIQKFNGRPIGIQLPPHVELTIADTEPAVRGDTTSGNVTKRATLQTGLEIRVPLFIKTGEKVKVHTETREFAGRA
jgi:elongation factor P